MKAFRDINNFLFKVNKIIDISKTIKGDEKQNKAGDLFLTFTAERDQYKKTSAFQSWRNFVLINAKFKKIKRNKLMYTI